VGYCFAAAVPAEDALKAKAISWVMVGGLAGAIIGPQLVIFTRDAVAGTPYVGSFLSQALLPLIALPILLMLRTPSQTQAEAVADSGRTVLQLLAMPRYLLAVAAGVVSYGVMAFVMTAAPVAMVNHGHSVDNAALGIQWHLLAMFGPSFFTGRLMVRYGKERVTAVGMVLLAASGVVALGGLGLSHFWGSLGLLGVGWNFRFSGASAEFHRRHGDGHRLPHPGRAGQGAGHERLLRLRRHGGRVVPRGVDPAQLGLASGQLDDLPGFGADPGAAAVAGSAKAAAIRSKMIEPMREAYRLAGAPVVTSPASTAASSTVRRRRP